MITLRLSDKDELTAFADMERQTHARKFIHATDLKTHTKNFDNPDIVYLSVEDNAGELCGYFILSVERNNESVEFRRVLIDQNRRGFGQAAIVEMENFCKTVLKVKRIWLDVYEDNEIGIHIYQKMEYTRFKVEQLESRKLIFFEKILF